MPDRNQNISQDIFALRESLNNLNIKGRFIKIEKLTYSLKDVFHYFSDEEIYNVLGFKKEDESRLQAIEKEQWSMSYLITTIRHNRFVGFARVLMLHETKRIIAIHGGCINSRFYDKICLIEAWFLGINECIEKFKCHEIRTTCMKNNRRAYKLNLRAGYKVVGEEGNLINFNLDFDLFTTLYTKLTQNYYKLGSR